MRFISPSMDGQALLRSFEEIPRQSPGHKALAAKWHSEVGVLFEAAPFWMVYHGFKESCHFGGINKKNTQRDGNAEELEMKRIEIVNAECLTNHVTAGNFSVAQRTQNEKVHLWEP